MNVADEPEFPYPQFDVGMRGVQLIALRNYWLKIRGDNPMPKAIDFQLTELGEIIPHISLVDVSHNPAEMKFRMLGSYVSDLAGRNSAGQTIDGELFPDNLEEVTWGFKYCAGRGVPVATEGPVDFGTRHWPGLEVLFVPLSGDDGAVSMVVACCEVAERRDELHQGPGDIIIDWQL